jgi:hypothetical protein
MRLSRSVLAHQEPVLLTRRISGPLKRALAGARRRRSVVMIFL